VSIEDAAELLLMFAVIPLWIASGIADWWCHRRTAIEHTSGLPENAFHWLLMAEGSVALLAVSLLEPDGAVLLLVFAAFLAHEVTTFVELRYTVPLRAVLPGEQMVHSFIELLPLVLLALLAVMRWDQVLAFFDGGEPDLALRLKPSSWPPAYLRVAGLAVLLLNALPLADESVRCARAARARR
jgi:hypothetical protein